MAKCVYCSSRPATHPCPGCAAQLCSECHPGGETCKLCTVQPRVSMAEYQAARQEFHNRFFHPLSEGYDGGYRMWMAEDPAVASYKEALFHAIVNTPVLVVGVDTVFRWIAPNNAGLSEWRVQKLVELGLLAFPPDVIYLGALWPLTKATLEGRSEYGRTQ